MNRHLNYAIVYSPADKENIQHHYQKTLKVLNKNCEKFLIAYELGKNETNPHLDIVACFKSKQARNDLTKKFNFLGTKPEVVYSVIKDLPYRVGYNQKESLDSPFNHNFNFTDSDIESAVQHYIDEEESRKVARKKYNLFTYIKESTFAYEYNKFILSNKLEEPTDQYSYELILKQMYLRGYIFTTIRSEALQKIGRQIIAVYKFKKDDSYNLEDDSTQLASFSQTDFNITDISDTVPLNYCSKCLTKFSS